jgi:hypothetical protein
MPRQIRICLTEVTGSRKWRFPDSDSRASKDCGLDRSQDVIYNTRSSLRQRVSTTPCWWDKHAPNNNPHQSSSLMLCFFFSCTNSSSLRASSAFAAAASCLAGMWYSTTIYRSCKWKPFRCSNAFFACKRRGRLEGGVNKGGIAHVRPLRRQTPQTPCPSSWPHSRCVLAVCSRSGRRGRTGPRP